MLIKILIYLLKFDRFKEKKYKFRMIDNNNMV
jgi:hypothetical protein